MKRLFCGLFVGAIVFGAALAPAARAQDGDSDRDGGGESRGHHDKWGHHLGLTDDQKAKMKAAFESMKKDAEPLRKQLKEAFKSLKEDLKGKDEKKLTADLAKLKDAKKALQAAREKAHESISSILTVEQRAKAALMMEKRKMMRRWEARRGGERGCRCEMGRKHHRRGGDRDDDRGDRGGDDD